MSHYQLEFVPKIEIVDALNIYKFVDILKGFVAKFLLPLYKRRFLTFFPLDTNGTISSTHLFQKGSFVVPRSSPRLFYFDEFEFVKLFVSLGW